MWKSLRLIFWLKQQNKCSSLSAFTKILVKIQVLPSLRDSVHTTNRPYVGSRPSDHFIVSVGLSVCLFVCAEFFSAVFHPISIKLGHMLCVWV